MQNDHTKLCYFFDICCKKDGRKPRWKKILRLKLAAVQDRIQELQTECENGSHCQQTRPDQIDEQKFTEVSI